MALPTLIWKDFTVRASASQCPWPLLGPHLFLFPCISSIFVLECLWGLQLFTRTSLSQGGSMSGRASYCNHWPVPQPPFGPWPPFPQLWAWSFISAEPGPRGRNDLGSLGLQQLSRLKLQDLWQILLLLLLFWLHTGITLQNLERAKMHSSRQPGCSFHFTFLIMSQRTTLRPSLSLWQIYNLFLTDLTLVLRLRSFFLWEPQVSKLRTWGCFDKS